MANPAAATLRPSGELFAELSISPSASASESASYFSDVRRPLLDEHDERRGDAGRLDTSRRSNRRTPSDEQDTGSATSPVIERPAIGIAQPTTLGRCKTTSFLCFHATCLRLSFV